jgi:hypothetical protein
VGQRTIGRARSERSAMVGSAASHRLMPPQYVKIP